MSKNFELDAEWKVNTAGLLQEVLANPGTEILTKPLQIFAGILAEVAERAAEVNDPELNHLMCRLAMYEVADPYNENFDQKVVDQVKKEAENARSNK